jgi:hypothetical protein
VNAHFVAEPPKAADPPPTCHVCGAAMALKPRDEKMKRTGREKKPIWECLSCGATTEPS